MSAPVRELLERSTEMMAQLSTQAAASYLGARVLREGTDYEYAEKPADVEWGEERGCFMNAALLALSRPDLTYVEGYAAPGDIPLPFPHAWTVTEDGTVIDNTWEPRDAETGWGPTYLGIPFADRDLMDLLAEVGTYGILESAVTQEFLGWMEREAA